MSLVFFGGGVFAIHHKCMFIVYLHMFEYWGIHKYLCNPNILLSLLGTKYVYGWNIILFIRRKSYRKYSITV